MILEIKPYHVDIILTQMYIVYKTKYTDWCENWIFKFSPTSSDKLTFSTNCFRLAANLVFLLSSSRTEPLNWFLNLNHSVLLALDMRILRNSTTSSWNWMWFFTVVYDTFCPMTYSFHIVFFCKQSSRILENVKPRSLARSNNTRFAWFSKMIISVVYRW